MLLARARNFVRRRLRAAQRGGHYPLLLPHHRVEGTTLRSGDGTEHPLAADFAAALARCDGRHTLGTIARDARCPRADLIRAHDDGLILFWREPIPQEPPAEPRALHGIVLSPHLDDAALSCGGRMLGDHAILVVNVFTRAAWWRFPFTADDVPRIQATRLMEESLVSRLSGCPTRALDLPEALLRGRTMDDVFTASADDRDAAVTQSIRDAVAALAHDHPLAHWYLPLGVGSHLDHRLTRDAALAALSERGTPPTHLHFYEDLPYAAKEPAADRSASLPGLTLRRDLLGVEEHLAWKLELLRAYWSQFRWVDLTPVRDYARRLGDGEPAEAVWTATTVP